MNICRGLLAVIGLAALVCPAAQGQKKPQMTARELFYTAPPEQAPPAKASKPKPPARQEQAAAKKRRNEERPAQETPNRTPDPPEVRLAKSGEGGEFIPASFVASARPLGLRYSILKYAGDEEYLEVDPEMVFRSGDRIRLRVQVNDPAYLYIVMRGSSGNWRVMFPSPEYDSGSNRVLPGRDYDIPSRTRFVFDETPGEEKLFFVLARQPEDDLDKMIYELDQRPASGAGTAPAGAPAATPAKTQPVKTMMAMNSIRIGDDVVGRLRSEVYARDLVFEKVDETTKPSGRAEAPAKEKAVYVVNPKTGAESRLVVDLALKHR